MLGGSEQAEGDNGHSTASLLHCDPADVLHHTTASEDIDMDDAHEVLTIRPKCMVLYFYFSFLFLLFLLYE